MLTDCGLKTLNLSRSSVTSIGIVSNSSLSIVNRDSSFCNKIVRLAFLASICVKETRKKYEGDGTAWKQHDLYCACQIISSIIFLKFRPISCMSVTLQEFAQSTVTCWASRGLLFLTQTLHGNCLHCCDIKPVSQSDLLITPKQICLSSSDKTDR